MHVIIIRNDDAHSNQCPKALDFEINVSVKIKLRVLQMEMLSWLIRSKCGLHLMKVWKIYSEKKDCLVSA